MANYLSLLSRITFRRPPVSPLVLFERANPVALNSLGIDVDDYYLVTRQLDVIFMGPQIFWSFFTRFWRLPSWHRTSLGQLYFKIIFDFMKTKVVFTTIDNNDFFFELSRNCPGIEFVALANCVRFDCEKDLFSKNNNAYPATFFCFGDFDKKTYGDYPRRIENIKAAGSVISDFYRTSKLNSQNTTPLTYDICLVSEWRADHMIDDNLMWSTVGVKEIIFKLTGYLRRLHKEYSFSICIAGVSPSDERERDFYRKELPFADFCFRCLKSPSTYERMDQSRLVIGLFSSCLYEAFSWGKKVLFCSWAPHPGTHCRAPGYWSLRYDQQNYELFSERVQYLLNLDSETYRQDTLKIANHLVKSDLENPAHLTIKNHIDRALNL